MIALLRFLHACADSRHRRGAWRSRGSFSPQSRAVLSWDESEEGVADIGASALLLGADRRVLSDGHLVFSNQTTSPEGAVRHLGRGSTGIGAEERVSVGLDEVPDEAAFVVLAASEDEPETNPYTST